MTNGGGMARVFGGVMLVAGILALLAPLVFGLAITLVIGWLLLLAAVVRGYYAVSSRKAGGFFMDLFVALLYGVGGLLVLFYPMTGAITLTLIVAVLFFIEGVFKLVAAFDYSGPGSGWLTVSGIIAVLLAILIYIQWPSEAAWILGLLVGINLVMAGLPMLLTGEPRSV